MVKKKYDLYNVEKNMGENKILFEKAQNLRLKAEKALYKKSVQEKDMSPAEMREILHELHVHQIELEMQDKELRSVQANLETSRKKYFDLYDFAPIGYLNLNKKNLVQEANLAAAELLGYERRRLISKGISCFIAPKDEDIFYLYRQKVIQTGLRQPYELTIQKKDGSSFSAHLQGICIQGNADEYQGLRLSLTDISQLKKTEEKLQKYRDTLEHLVKERTEELEKTNQALQRKLIENKRLEKENLKNQKVESISTLAGGIAHDFNNYLSVITTNVSLAKMYGKLDEQTAELLQAIESACKPPKNLSHQLITFSRGGELIKKTISLSSLLQQTATLCLSGSRVKSRIVLPENLWRAEADEGQIAQVFSNCFKRAKEAGGPFDVVILDLTIPGGMGGREAIQKLKAIDPKVKAIVSSGFSNDPVMAHYKKYGFHGILPKPYPMTELIRVLKNLLVK